MKFRLNDDKLYVEDVKKRLKENDGYCPCRLKKNADTKCMCKEFRDQLKSDTPGFCHCGLYEAYS